MPRATSCVPVLSLAPLSLTRLVSGALAAGLLLGIVTARGASDLLDPAKIGSRPAAAKTLPSAPTMGASLTRTEGGSGRQPSFARDMAASVVANLDSLTTRGAALLQERAKRQSDLEDLDSKRRELIRNKDDEMEDYRRGLFCSGCNRTKRDIESKEGVGRFPHTGERIIKPTQEQIDAKERALQAPIDRAAAEMVQGERRIKEMKAFIDEVLDQIDVGIQLWSVAVQFEGRLIHRLEREHIAANRTAKQKIEPRLDVLNAELRRLENAQPRDNQRIATALADRKSWQVALERLGDERRARRRQHGDLLMQADLTARDEAARINGFVVRGSLSLYLSPMAVASMTNLFGTGLNRAGDFRLGESTPERRGDTVASVQEFVQNFVRTSSERSPTLGTPEQLPTVPPGPMERARHQLKDLLEPGPGEKTKSKLTNPGGVRG